MTDKITEATRRTQAYWFIDGLAETGTGILFVVTSIPYLLWSLVPQGSAWSKLASNGRDILLILGIAILFIVVRSIKLHSTYPRTGYMEEKQPGRKQILMTGTFSLAGVLVFAGLMVTGSLLWPAFRMCLVRNIAYLPTIIGLFFMAFQIILGFRTGLRRFFVMAGIAALASLGLFVAARFYLATHPFDWTFITTTGPNDPMPAGSTVALTDLLHYVYMGAAIFFAMQGLAMLVSGLLVRRKYLHQNPVTQEEMQ
jgi:hypothetical protein